MVSVLDKQKKPLDPCTEKRARQLLEKGRAVVHKMFPFTIRLKDRLLKNSATKSMRLKLDPGSKTTGIAVLDGDNVIILAELKHKPGIKKAMDARRGFRRRRRNKNLRYRKPRFNNRKRKDGWLPVSLEARVNQTINVAEKLAKLLPIMHVSVEHIKFDTQLLQNPDICSIEYQQGTLHGYEVREYLLEKFGRKCVYCGKKDCRLEIEHIVPKSKGGSNRISNLTISCNDCNNKKGTMTAEEFGFLEVQKLAKKPLKDAAMMNATRWRTFERLKKSFKNVECGSGGLTKLNRINHKLGKTHYYDACCVGKSTPEKFNFKTKFVLEIAAKGRGRHARTNTDASGFPNGYLSRQKFHYGFQTGDVVKAEILKGKYKGLHIGNIAARKTGYLDIKNNFGKRIAQGISYKYCKILQRFAGYQYNKRKVD